MLSFTKSRLAGKKLAIIFCFVSIVFSLLLFSGCNSDENDGINIPPIDIPDTLGNVTGYINSLDGPIEDVYITLDNKTTFSDSNGFFQLKDCIKKDLVITISHPEFSEYSNSINVTDSLNLNIELTRIKYDYFPLKVGNHWQYYWIRSGYTPAGSFYLTAKIDWGIVSKSGNYPVYTFKIKETFFDSTYNTSTERFFNIKTSNNDSITFIGVNTLIGDNNIIRRYFTTDYPETIHQMDPLHEFERNVGFTGFNYGWGGIQMGYQWWCEIIYYSLN